MTANPTILIVCGAGYVSGKEIISLTLARALKLSGFEVSFLVSAWNNGDFISRIEASGYKYDKAWLGFISASLRRGPLKCTLDQLLHLPVLFARYKRLMKRNSFHAVVHTNWQHSLLLLPLLTASRDLHWVHEIAPQTRRYAHLYRSLSKRTRRFVCVSSAAKESIISLGVQSEKIDVVHNGIEIVDRAPRLPNGQALRLGIVGQIAPWKGHEDLIDALATVIRGGDQVILHIFGAGTPEYIDLLKRRVAELGLEESVRWPGFVREQAKIFSQIDACVVPSRREESFGMSAVEAGAFGRAVICSARGGLVEIVKDGVTGILVEAGRPDELARAISALARDRELLGRMGAAGRAHAVANFSSTAFAKRFIEVIDGPGE